MLFLRELIRNEGTCFQDGIIRKESRADLLQIVPQGCSIACKSP